jgi:CRISPR-associated protein Cmr2
MKHVLILGLGPVQEFLAAARRTRDLWFGSWMLSELARAGARTLAEQPGSELVFPHPELLDDETASFANKIVARVEDPAGSANAAITSIRARLAALRDDAFRDCRRDPQFVLDAAEKQIADLVELYWSSAAIEPGEAGYHDARDRADRLLTARRQSRLWAPVGWGKDVPKSAIDGQRESVLHESLFDDPALLPVDLYRRFRIDDNERLCGVSLLKRLGRRKSNKFAHHFLSTGHLAAGPLLERLSKLAQEPERKSEAVAAWNALIRTIGDQRIDLTESRIFTEGYGHPILGAIDASLLFESRLPDFYPELRTRTERRDAALPLERFLRRFLEVVGVSTPCPYFAVLVADGDHMGDAIDRLTTPEQHRDFSRALGRFSATAHSVVEGRFGGELVYSGGDDVLAFVPLHQVIGCARELNEEFGKAIEPFAAGADDRKPTLSAGIGIGHFLEPLQRVLGSARSAERQAKETRGALAIRIEKRSGPPLVLAGPWGDLDVQIEEFVELLVSERLPDRAAFDLRDLSRLLEGTGAGSAEAPTRRDEAERIRVAFGDEALARELRGENGPPLERLVRREAERILRRKQPNVEPKSDREPGLADEDRKRLLAVFDDLAERLDQQPLLAFADRLIAARLFAEAKNQATLPALPALQVAA